MRLQIFLLEILKIPNFEVEGIDELMSNQLNLYRLIYHMCAHGCIDMLEWLISIIGEDLFADFALKNAEFDPYASQYDYEFDYVLEETVKKERIPVLQWFFSEGLIADDSYGPLQKIATQAIRYGKIEVLDWIHTTFPEFFAANGQLFQPSLNLVVLQWYWTNGFYNYFCNHQRAIAKIASPDVREWLHSIHFEFPVKRYEYELDPYSYFGIYYSDCQT